MVTCATPPSRRTASRGSGGTEGPTRDQNKKGACRTKLHRERRRRGAWDGAVAVQQVLFPGHSLARARVGVASAEIWSPRPTLPIGRSVPATDPHHWSLDRRGREPGERGREDGLGTRQV